MKRLSILKWDELGMAIEAHEPPTVLGAQLFQILDDLGFTAEEVQRIARSLFSFVDSSGSWRVLFSVCWQAHRANHNILVTNGHRSFFESKINIAGFTCRNIATSFTARTNDFTRPGTPYTICISDAGQ